MRLMNIEEINALNGKFGLPNVTEGQGDNGVLYRILFSLVDRVETLEDNLTAVWDLENG